MKFAKSLSGHDKGRYYFVTKEENELLFLVNGTTRPLEKAKKKNSKHVQLIKKLPEEIERILESEQTNLSIRKAITAYEKLVYNRK